MNTGSDTRTLILVSFRFSVMGPVVPQMFPKGKKKDKQNNYLRRDRSGHIVTHGIN